MELNLVFFALAIPAVIFAGISKGGFGSGAAFAATPLLALILEPGPAIGVMLPLLMLMDVSALRPYWRQWDPRAAWVLILGGVPGVAFGALLYGIADPDVFRLLIGVIALGFVSFQIGRGRGWIRPAARPISDKAGLGLGVIGGFTSFISHAGGPLAAIYLLSKPIDKRTYQATTVIVFWAINVVKFVPYLALGIFDRQTLIADLYLAPFAFLGVYLGVWFHRIVPERLFFRLVYIFLTVTGAKLIFDALG
ncbi:MAG: sulfite exporter TauE/SafE family protein [Rhodobacter sp.]|nr:sulfite exporter TauE/SafE family protein [Rhodobacter sp.]